jgi:hypothetical protein
VDTKSVGAIIIKITGLVMVVLSVVQIPAYFPLTNRGFGFSIGEFLATAGLALGPLALAGLLLWFFPGTITNRIVSGAPPAGSSTDFRPLELVAITVLGIYLFADGLVGAVRDIAIFIAVNRQNPSELVPASIVGHVSATAAQLVIGAILCIGAKGISTTLERLRR